MKTALEVRTMAVSKLVPAPYNPRKVLKPADPAYQKLRSSLESFGLVEPLVWNELTGHVVGGHARLRILKELGVKRVPVSVVRLSAASEKALNVVLNNTEAQGRYDPGRLGELLAELQPLPLLAQTGFAESMLRILRMHPIPAPPSEPEDPDRLEIVLVTTTRDYQKLEAPLNELIRQFDLEVHVKQG